MDKLVKRCCKKRCARVYSEELQQRDLAGLFVSEASRVRILTQLLKVSGTHDIEGVKLDSVYRNLDILADMSKPARVAAHHRGNILEIIVEIRNAIIAGFERFTHD